MLLAVAGPASRAVEFDPPPLAPDWYRPGAASRACAALPDRATLFTWDDDYGRLNNALIALVNAVAYALQRRAPAGVLLPRAWTALLGAERPAPLDVDAATRDWACVLARGDARAARFAVDNATLGARDAFRLGVGLDDRFYGTVLSQLLLRPAPRVRSHSRKVPMTRPRLVESASSSLSRAAPSAAGESAVGGAIPRGVRRAVFELGAFGTDPVCWHNANVPSSIPRVGSGALRRTRTP